MYKSYYVYILSNQNNSVLYVGVTGDLVRRLEEHKGKFGKQSSFTRKYNIDKLVYYESYNDIRDAIAREKQLKGGSRKKKETLIETTNPEWKDLSVDLFL
jgi:putative endonuclease